MADLFLLVYDELKRMARRHLSRERAGHTLQPTALVHEAWMRLSKDQHVVWQGRTHVVALGAQAMRRLLVEHGRGRRRVKRGGGVTARTLHDWLDAPEERAVSIDEALDLDQALASLAEADPRQARIVEMRFFGGMTVPEVAEALQVSPRTVEGEWTHAKAWLRRALSPRV